MKEEIKKIDAPPISEAPLKAVEEQITRLLNREGGEKADPLRRKMQSVMMDYGSVFRDEEGLKKGIEEIQTLKERYHDIAILNKGKAFNYELMEAIELGHQLNLSEVILLSALHRRESRGACEDF
jgi:succinate dehydrogenase / fumarate reductase flavoprotein subunit